MAKTTATDLTTTETTQAELPQNTTPTETPTAQTENLQPDLQENQPATVHRNPALYGARTMRVELRSGLTLEKAYVTAASELHSNTTRNYAERYISIRFDVFANAESFSKGEPPIDELSFTRPFYGHDYDVLASNHQELFEGIIGSAWAIELTNVGSKFRDSVPYVAES